MSSYYKQVQAESFSMHNTIPNDWDVCEIADKKEGIHRFKIPYKCVEAWSARVGIKRQFILGDVCELCGHPIKNLFFIKCESKEICMCVGSECVNSFKGATFSRTFLKKYEETEARKAMIEWLKTVLEDEKWANHCNRSSNGYVWYPNPVTRKFRRRLDGWKRRGIDGGQYEYDIPVKHRLIMSAFKKGKELGLKCPQIYDDLMSKKVKKTGLPTPQQQVTFMDGHPDSTESIHTNSLSDDVYDG